MVNPQQENARLVSINRAFCMADNINFKNGAVIVGLGDMVKKFERLSTTDPMTAKMLHDEIRGILKYVRDELVKDAKIGLDMKSDPRQAVRAVKHTVYKKILGGNVNILNGKRGKVSTDRGSAKKREYFGSERGFVLRFLNQGTRNRYVGFRNNKANEKKYNEMVASGNRTAFRGRIEPRGWFGGASQKELEKAAEMLDKYIENVIKKIMV